MKIVDCYLDGYGSVNRSVSNFLFIIIGVFVNKILSNLVVF